MCESLCQPPIFIVVGVIQTLADKRTESELQFLAR